jgi:hypothetical protein
LFNAARTAVSLKKPPLIVPGEQYVLVATFEYHLPLACTLIALSTVPSSGIEFHNVAFGLPLTISLNEAFTTACFVKTGFCPEPKSLGRYELKYTLAGVPDAVFFTMPMPKVEFVPKKGEVILVVPETLLVNTPTSLHLSVKGLTEGGLECELVIGESFSFRVQCEPRRALSVPPNGEVELDIPFIPIQAGKQIFPALTLVEGGTQLWTASPTFIVRNE